MSSIQMRENSILDLLSRVQQVSHEMFAKTVGDDTLTSRQYAVLAAISRDEGPSQTRIVELTGIDRSTLADIVRRLLRKGLITRRRRKEDARAYALRLTAEGEKVLARAAPLVARVQESILGPLPASRRRELLADLEVLSHTRPRNGHGPVASGEKARR